MNAAWVSTMMLVYGVAAAIGNVVGGRMTDKLSPDRVVMIVLVGLAVVLAAMWPAVHSVSAMAVLIAALGALTYAAVPAMQARVIGIAERQAPRRWPPLSVSISRDSTLALPSVHWLAAW